MDIMTIGTAASLAGVGIETLRYYERKGLIEKPEKPRGGGYRHYSADIVRKIQFVRQAQELGFSLGEIGILLNLRSDPGTRCGAVHKRATRKLQEVKDKIARLEKISGTLKQVIAACPSRGGLDGCTIVAALENRSGKVN